MRKQKGFTLIEMIIVIGIIGILLAVLVPTWSYFIMKANLKSQNSYSKIIFNAAQTQVTRLENREKRDYNVAVNNIGSAAEVNQAKKNLFLSSDMDADGKFEFYLYWNGKTATQVKANGDVYLDPNPNQKLVDEFASAINKVFGESSSTVYKVYVKDYKVESVCSARSDGSEVIGAYPVMQDGRTSGGSVLKFDMTTID